MRTNNMVSILLDIDKYILDAANRAGLKENEEGYLKYILEQLMRVFMSCKASWLFLFLTRQFEFVDVNKSSE